jgi:uncharacterized membrane protein
MDVVILRVIHIGSGVFWVGGIFTFFLFVQPAAVALGPGGAPFTFQLLHHRRFGVVLLSAAIVTGTGSGLPISPSTSEAPTRYSPTGTCSLSIPRASVTPVATAISRPSAGVTTT